MGSAKTPRSCPRSTQKRALMGLRTARQSAHSAAVHGGNISIRLPACNPSDTIDESWDVLSVSSEDSFELIGGGYRQASAKLSERHRCILQAQRNKRAATWSLKQDLCSRLSHNRVQVRIASAYGCALRATARCWFDDRGPEAQKRLDDAFEWALTAFVARNEEALRHDELVAFALRHTPADYELSRSSWVRRIGIDIRPSRIGFFCAFPWEVPELNNRQVAQGEKFLSADDPHSGRICRRESPAHCSARTGRRRSRHIRQSTQKLLIARSRAEEARARDMRRRREVEEKLRECDLFVDMPAVGSEKMHSRTAVCRHARCVS